MGDPGGDPCHPVPVKGDTDTSQFGPSGDGIHTYTSTHGWEPAGTGAKAGMRKKMSKTRNKLKVDP